MSRAILDGLLVFWALAVGPLCWLLRDGLGPDTVDSHGLHAVFRFCLTFHWGPVLASLATLRLIAGRLRGADKQTYGGQPEPSPSRLASSSDGGKVGA
jgi:hypothetical protein